MKKILLITTLLAFAIGCQDLGGFGSNYFSAVFNKFITKAQLTVELEKDGEQIKFTVTNNSGLPLSLFAGDTPIKGIGKDLFKVHDGKKFLPYIGRHVYRKLGPANWITLEAYESRGILVRLDNIYQFVREGDYEIYFDSVITVKTDDRDVRIVEMISNSVYTFIDTPSTALLSFGAKEKCNTNQSKNLDAGKDKGKDMTVNAINYLDTYGADKFYLRWFGEYTDNRYNKVYTGYNRTEKTFNIPWEYSCETPQTESDCKGYVAWVYSNRPQEVWVCMNHYDGYNLKDKGSLMIHEASHWNTAFGSDDAVYGYNNGINLAKRNPDRAINCANNIEYYAWEIPSVDDPPPPDETSVTLNSKQFKPGEIFTVTFSGTPGNATDWLGMFEPGAPREDSIEWHHTDGQKDGTMRFTAPIIEGNYEVRVYFENVHEMQASVSFKVNDDVIPIDGDISIDKDTFAVKEKIKVKYSGLDNSKKYKIGVFPRGTVDNKNPIKKKTIKKKVKGRKKFKLKTPGKYEFHLYLKKSQDIIDKIEFVIEGDDPPPPDEASFKLNKDVYKVNEPINVIYTNLPGNELDWIGIFNRGAPNEQWLQWLYAGPVNGTMQFNGLPAGDYDMRLFFDDSYNVEYEVKFKVEGDEPPPGDSWTWIMYGDTRSQDNRHRQVLKAMVRNTPKYELILNAGDVVESGGSTSQWRTWSNALTDILGSTLQNGTPPKYMSCPGNHDDVEKSDGMRNWNNYLSGQVQYGNKGEYFTFDYKNARFIILNSERGISINWLREAVNKSPKKTWLFAIWHYPVLYDDWVNPLKDGNYDGTFHGHNHNYERDQKGNAFKIIVGTGGAPLTSGGDIREYGYCEVIMNGNKMTVKFIDIYDKVRDTVVYTANSK